MIAAPSCFAFRESCACLHRWPLPVCPVTPPPMNTHANPCTPLCFAHPVTIARCSLLPASVLLILCPFQMSDLRRCFPPTTLPIGQAMRGSCLCAPKTLDSLHCHHLSSSLSPSMDCSLRTLIMLPSSSCFLTYKME